MKKLRLDVDRLEVESFAIARGGEARGTVEGHVSLRCTGGGATCNGDNTCADGYTCGAAGSCYLSCAGTCPAPCTYELSLCYC
jgi:hypothetical protein